MAQGSGAVNAKFKGEVTVATTHENRIVITQKRVHQNSKDNVRHYTVSLTRDEAKLVREQLGRQIALLETLEAQDVWLNERNA